MPVGGSSVGVADSAVGPILVDPSGLTLYMFTKDVDGESTCAGECLANWPAAVVEGEPDVGDLDASLFSTVASTDGATMLKVGDWPLYTFAGDAAPGDMNGQGVGGVWWVVTPNGNPIAHASVVETDLGPTVVNGLGMTLYAFLNDTEGVPTCAGDCLVNWPAALVETGEAAGGSSVPGSAPEAEAPQLFVGDLDPALFSVVEGQLKMGDWPLYLFAGDSAAGDVNGQAVGDVWFARRPTAVDRDLSRSFRPHSSLRSLRSVEFVERLRRTQPVAAGQQAGLSPQARGLPPPPAPRRSGTAASLATGDAAE